MKRTYQPSILARKRKHGFLKRNKTKKGRITLLNRKIKGRNTLCK
jgi:large subunit ribosomal protein L34